MSHLLKTASLQSAGEALFLNEEFSDIVILVKSSGLPWRFPAHGLILSSQSRVFRCMLENDFTENNSRQITIEDVTPTTIERLLKYMYSGKVDLENWKEALDLLRAAHRYQVDALIEMCGKFLENVITLSNVCYLYDESVIFNLISLKEKCLKLILDAGFFILRDKTFEILNKDSVLEIITDPNLNVDSELTVFEALLRWAPMQCCRTNKEVTESNILLELQPFLQHVCSDDMSDTDKSALPTSILACLKPSNRNRILFSVPESLLLHSHNLSFVKSDLVLSAIGTGLKCIRFSCDAPVYFIAFNFTVVAVDTPSQLSIVLVRESVNNMIVFTFNISPLMWVPKLQMNDRKQFCAYITLRQPVRLEDRTVYKIHCLDRGQSAQCLKCELKKKTLYTAHGHVNFTMHSEETWGISSMKFV